MGSSSLILAIFISGYAIYGKYVFDAPAQGSASLLIVVTFFSGATLTFPGVIAEYLEVTMGIVLGKPQNAISMKPTQAEIIK